MYHDSGIFYKNVGRLWRVSDCEELLGVTWRVSDCEELSGDYLEVLCLCEELVGVTWKVSDCEELVGGYSYKDNKTNQEVLLTSSL